ncbi:hypothetical protein RPB_1509 [Rhodopseudomonas palustris HaA2]|uniref:Transmembrane protein n=1 Tax=Rhodopseudomonas palustris (strain HaA2) TaxID=316058 RepID=Q2IZZ1_RHOP2|nr:hypothetical protein [Rhodopseudomonas palustris]ABD06219.1 hypothetical protein RPB_1509 [Rhodopseudomonas palustris HaA2]
MNNNLNDTDHRAELDRHMAWFESKLPPKPAGFVGWLRKPSSKYVRLPVGVLLVGGGVFSFLPVLGLWMLPLGLVLIAQDVPALEKPTARTLGWLERKWVARQRKKGVDITPFAAAQDPDSVMTASDSAGESRAKA